MSSGRTWCLSGIIFPMLKSYIFKPKNVFEKADIVRKIISRYLHVPLSNGFKNICCQESAKQYFNNIIELKNFSSNVCLFQVANKRGKIPRRSKTESSASSALGGGSGGERKNYVLSSYPSDFPCRACSTFLIAQNSPHMLQTSCSAGGSMERHNITLSGSRLSAI